MLTLDFLGNKKKVSFLPQMQLREMDTVVLPFPPIHSLTSGLTAIPCGGHLKPVTRGCKNQRNGRPPCLSLRQTGVQFQRSLWDAFIINCIPGQHIPLPSHASITPFKVHLLRTSPQIHLPSTGNSPHQSLFPGSPM